MCDVPVTDNAPDRMVFALIWAVSPMISAFMA
jgi:hypothetical protein